MACEAGSKYMTRTMIGKILWHTKFEVIRYLFLRVNVRSTQTDGCISFNRPKHMQSLVNTIDGGMSNENFDLQN